LNAYVSDPKTTAAKVTGLTGLMVSIGVLSAAIIAYQFALMQLLSIVQWYHFAYLVISVALLGFGAAGTVLSLWRSQLKKHIDVLLPALMISCGIAMATVTGVSQTDLFRFDSYLLFTGFSQIGKLLLAYLLFFIPFFLGALAIGLCFDHHVSVIGKIYFANLLGSGIGALLVIFLIWHFFPVQLPAVIALLSVAAGCLLIFCLPIKSSPESSLHNRNTNRKTFFISTKFILSVFAMAGIISSTMKIYFPPPLRLSQFKDFSKTLLLPDAEVTLEKSSPFGFLQAVKSPVLRYAPGLSLTTPQTEKTNTAVFQNGDWLGAVSGSKKDDDHILRYSTFHLPYLISNAEAVFIPGSGTGMEVSHAFRSGAVRITAAEPNRVLTRWLQHELARENDSLFTRAPVMIHNKDPRSFLQSDTGRYNLIVLPPVGSFGGAAGLNALREQFLLTKESLILMWQRLHDEGVLAATAWMDYPARQPLKLLASFAEVLEKLNVPHPANHIAAVRSWNTISFAVKKKPLTETDIQKIRNFCEELQFDPALLPGISEEERTRYHFLQDSSFLPHLDRLLTTERKELYATYDFNIRPATDNKPYFSQFIRLKSLPRLAAYFGNRSIPFFELGYLLVIFTFLQIAVVSVILIVLPLVRMGGMGYNKFAVLLYFTGIGIGFMFVEIVFIQHFILYFGQPVFAAAAVITSMLVFSGIGSFYSVYFVQKRKKILLILTAIMALLLLYSMLLNPVLRATAHENMLIKAAVVFLIMAPVSFCMGIPFPAGLKYLSQAGAEQIPWAWGINGCASVISTALATVIAVESGFKMVLWIAALAYSFPLIVYSRWK
jgi:hypothetical protein